MSKVVEIEELSSVLARGYALIAELWCNPADLDVEKVAAEGREVAKALREVDSTASSLLERFLSQYPPTEEAYVDLFELNPKCPLYLGSHVFDEPRTCAEAAVSDRNEYMLDLIGMYRHFGFSLKGKELPDFLPAMVEILALTADSQDPIRRKFIEEYLVPFLPPLRSRLEALESSYADLLDGLKRLLALDLKAHGEGVIIDAR
ncbi:MAG: hypothetical protein KatS3mg081_1554 [Gemmatimonadales bacterium]|nr:MAG: hypothetical protein KatS3mg081_1554 [Gemmatimonadales bacterium]